MTALERRKRRLQKAAWTLKNPVPKKKNPNVNNTFGHHHVKPVQRSTPGWRKRLFRRRIPSMYDEPIEPLDINLTTYRLMKADVLYRISQGNGRSCTVFDAIESIKSSREVMESFAADETYSLGVASWNLICRKEVRHTKLRYKIMAVLEEIEARPSACERITSWEEVEDVLREHMNFPEDPAANQQQEITAEDPIERMMQRIDRDSQEKINLRIAEAQRLYNHVAKYSFARQDRADQDNAERFTEETEKRAARLASEELRTSEERLLREEREAEAQERASQLLRDLTPEEQELVREALHSVGPEDDVAAKSDTDFVTRKNMQTLQPGAWLSDEVIHFFLAMLAKRDEELCREDSDRKRSHFFKSFFMTKLTNEGHQNPSISGTYEYRNVKRWSKKVPGKDIFNLDKIIFPINVGEVHWVCAVAFMQEKRIQYYDSFGGDGMHYLEFIMRYIKDEHEDKKKEPLPEAEEWRLIPCEPGTPRQRNGYDCGVFTCMFADFLSKDCPLVFGQDHVNQCRERIALSILQGRAIM